MSIRATYLLVFLVVLVILASQLLVMSLVVRTQRQIVDSADRRYQSYRLADELRQSSDDLTRMARTYVVTTDPVFEQYFELTGKFLRSAIIIGNNRQTIDSVAANPRAIGFVTFAAVMMAQARGVKIKYLILEGREGPKVTVRNLSPRLMFDFKFLTQMPLLGLRSHSGLVKHDDIVFSMSER